MGTKAVECERLLTDEDFKKIKRLKKKAQEERELAKMNANSGPSIHMPTFDFLEERERLKKMTNDMENEAFEDECSHDGAEEGDDEMDMEGEEEIEFEDGDIVEEEDMEEESGSGEIDEEGDEEMMEEELEGEEEFEGDEEDDLEEEDEEEETVVTKGKKIEKKAVKKGKKKPVDDFEVNSSFYDDSESEELEDPSRAFLSSTAIYNPEKVKKRKTLDQIKNEKKEHREEQKQKKLSHKIKERGRLTNKLKKKNNPFQMFIQKRRMENRLKDLKKASKKIKSKLHKGHNPRKLGNKFGRK